MRLTMEQLHAFTEELLALRHEIDASLSKKDYQHLKKIIWINRILLMMGYATAWMIPNPLSMVAIGLSLTGMWTIVAHHVLHGGYDQVVSVPKRYHSEYLSAGVEIGA